MEHVISMSSLDPLLIYSHRTRQGHYKRCHGLMESVGHLGAGFRYPCRITPCCRTPNKSRKSNDVSCFVTVIRNLLAERMHLSFTLELDSCRRALARSKNLRRKQVHLSLSLCLHLSLSLSPGTSSEVLNVQVIPDLVLRVKTNH
ncbi:hypothetical protein MPTK1_2g20820 [Marchantia polymorpha subsp. ruderalis]|uniref:Uncharacterized protein n=1 Tax=Marchantia polymorpha TaxID=3197 RepID=A0A2R6X2Z3_MARPO|nr:hypothetical protein MARPO_0040s0130 [Marchantia polymorpha]BBN03107.1 hypothetical protein Mp_2g20820 [Marchantia polymorpha subsp. ruderalis]|eukprot:PTQ40468.1 hypothetical protein MARPO_0040s0130 [Marchantia polymorpha]